jgi:sterol desaturase/sphingolipid hydroxylase (fatty acid hydroxylase superfamily)
LKILAGFAFGALLTAFIIILCTVIEQIAVIERYSLRSRLPGLAMNLVQIPLTAVIAWPINQFWNSLAIGKIITVPLGTWLAPLGGIGYALQVLIIVMLADFLAYWRHRTEHKLFWPIHMVHHSPSELHAANDIGHPLQVLFSIAFISFPMSLAQIEGPTVPAIASFIVLLLSYYIHSPIDVHFGPLRKVLVDNRFHRIHHSLEPRHFDKNFGICFSLWDRWFGTAYDPASDEWPHVGLEGVVPPRTIRDYLLLPFRAGAARGTASETAKAETNAIACVTDFGNLSPRS